MGPSGVGKDTMVHLLKEKHPQYFYLPSVTTRSPRPGEEEGSPYYFVTEAQFDEYMENNQLLEWGSPHGLARYGTLLNSVSNALEENDVVYKEMDMKGYQLAKQSVLAPKMVSIFLMPPSIEALRGRILHRGAMSEEELTIRLDRAAEEMRESDGCTFKILAEEGEIDKIYRQVEDIFLRKISSGA